MSRDYDYDDPRRDPRWRGDAIEQIAIASDGELDAEEWEDYDIEEWMALDGWVWDDGAWIRPENRRMSRALRVAKPKPRRMTDAEKLARWNASVE